MTSMSPSVVRYGVIIGVTALLLDCVPRILMEVTVRSRIAAWCQDTRPEGDIVREARTLWAGCDHIRIIYPYEWSRMEKPVWSLGMGLYPFRLLWNMGNDGWAYVVLANATNEVIGVVPTPMYRIAGPTPMSLADWPPWLSAQVRQIHGEGRVVRCRRAR